MADLIFYTNPQSRGRIVRWMLEEVGQPYATEVIPYDELKNERFLAVNPMGKVPAIKHRDHVVTECAAICAYLADTFPESMLGPRTDEKADYYRWFFFAAGPVESAISNKAMGWEPTPERERMLGYGNFERTIAVLDEFFTHRDYVCGDRFTAADVYVGSQVMFPLQFGMLPERESFLRYRDRLQARAAYKRASAIDDEAVTQAQPVAPQPA
ncbi:MAG TPA: glutathione S-transferase family protein [Sphingomicrobium sp.]|nr:glutathione S-transferase family protein [Sphingomicrobium sp.]